MLVTHIDKNFHYQNIKLYSISISVKIKTIHDFSVWLITGSNPVDINRFRSYIGKLLHFEAIQSDSQTNRYNILRSFATKKYF